MPFKKSPEISLSHFKEFADVKGEKTDQQQKDRDKDIGHGRSEISGDFPFEYGPDVVDKCFAVHTSPVEIEISQSYTDA